MGVDIRIYRKDPNQDSDDSDEYDQDSNNKPVSDILRDIVVKIRKQPITYSSSFTVNLQRRNIILEELFSNTVFVAKDFMRETIRKLNTQINDAWLADEREESYDRVELKDLQEAVMFCHFMLDQYTGYWVEYSC